MHLKIPVRSVFISDIHLGAPFCRITPLIRCLQTLDPQQVYLVGDIFDGWRIARRRPKWNSPCIWFVQRVLTWISQGVPVTYVTGNHDEFLRHYTGFEVPGFRLLDETTHETAKGNRYLVTHGDSFDKTIKYDLLTHIGSVSYEWLLMIDNYWGTRISHFCKRSIKKACLFISSFEEFVVSRTVTKGCQGIICGHIHQPADRQIQSYGNVVHYLNCGDWVENRTIVVETIEGELEVWQYDDNGNYQKYPLKT